MTEATAQAVAETLKALDRDRYFASLVLPSERRAPVQALWAASAEIAAIRERVSEPAPGEIRLQWWNDLIEGEGHGATEANPVAAALKDVISTHDLQAGPLVRLVAARRFDLYQDPMPDMATFEGYAGETHSILFQYAAQILDGDTRIDGDAAGHLGVAQALIGHIRAFGYNAAQGRLFLPQDVFAAHGVTEAEIFTGRNSDRLRTALGHLADIASEHLQKARAAISTLPSQVRPAFAQIALLDAELASRRRAEPDPFAGLPPPPDWQSIGRLMLWMLRR